MTAEAAGDVVGEAVLRDYPLRLWARQQEHSDELVREFTLLVSGVGSGEADAAPASLVALAELFSTRFGGLIDQITADRQAALDAGLDRTDSRIPLLRALPELLDQVQGVWVAVDDYCRSGAMLALARPPDVVALLDWTTDELLRQWHGAPPTPWPGPF